jgi:antitoxin component YwqK of YwqJK toxin-antitoxin module
MHKLSIFLTILCLFSCQTNNTNIISRWDNGKTKLERVYSDTPNIYIEKHYYENGQLASESRFVDSTKNGESIAYYEDGKLLGKCFYKNGKINGVVTEFHETGTLMFKGNQVDGNLVGKAINYFKNGKPETELFYKNNKGFHVNSWDSNGVQQVINGNGIEEFQSELDKGKNGNDTTINVLIIGTYKDSLCNGVWKFYNTSDRKLILERTFRDDKVVSETWE